MTKQFCGNNPILHINSLSQICLKLQVTEKQSECKMDSLTLKNLYKVEVKVYIFENHIYTKLSLSELSKDKLHCNSYKRHRDLFCFEWAKRCCRREGNNR